MNCTQHNLDPGTFKRFLGITLQYSTFWRHAQHQKPGEKIDYSEVMYTKFIFFRVFGVIKINVLELRADTPRYTACWNDETNRRNDGDEIAYDVQYLIKGQVK